MIDDGVHSYTLQAREGKVPVPDVFGDGAPTFQHWSSTAVNQTDQTGTVTDHPPSSDSYMCYCSQPSGEREDRTVFFFIFGDQLQVVDDGAHSDFCRLWMSDFFYAVGESLLGDDNKHYYCDISRIIPFIISSSVGVGYI